MISTNVISEHVDHINHPTVSVDFSRDSVVTAGALKCTRLGQFEYESRFFFHAASLDISTKCCL